MLQRQNQTLPDGPLPNRKGRSTPVQITVVEAVLCFPLAMHNELIRNLRLIGQFTCPDLQVKVFTSVLNQIMSFAPLVAAMNDKGLTIDTVQEPYPRFRPVCRRGCHGKSPAGSVCVWME